MKKNPIISVIIPVYNAENFIEESIKSILNQSFRDIEVICVNDCSPDGSLKKLYELQSMDDRVKVLDLPKNVGAGMARNEAIKIASGEYLTFVDADDVIENDLYEKVYSATKNGCVDQVTWGLVEDYYDANGTLIKTVPIAAKEEVITDEGFVEKVLELEEKTLFGYLWNSMYRTEIVKKQNIQIPDMIFYEDYFFNLEFAKYSKSIAAIEYIGYHYAKRPNNSITHQFSKDYYALSYARIESMYEFCKERGYAKEDMYNILGNRLLRYTLSALSRNSSQQSGMSAQEQKHWFKSIREKRMYSTILPQCKTSNIAYSVLNFLIEHNCSGCAVLIGKIINKIRG